MLLYSTGSLSMFPPRNNQQSRAGYNFKYIKHDYQSYSVKSTNPICIRSVILKFQDQSKTLKISELEQLLTADSYLSLSCRLGTHSTIAWVPTLYLSAAALEARPASDWAGTEGWPLRQHTVNISRCHWRPCRT